MQAFAPVADADFLHPVQRMRYRLEVHDGSNWLDLCALGESGEEKDYLKGISISLGGARIDTNPIAGTWSAVIDNRLGIFHPKHPTSAYATLLRVGREVRISVGGNYGGVDYYWQRLIGFMDAPRFDHGSHTVQISGMDYMKLLADKVLYDSTAVTESGSGSGSTEAFDIVHGPTRWGGRVTFDAIATAGSLGAEIYAEGDALEIGAGEANNVAGWVSDANCSVVSTADIGGGSAFVALIEKDTDLIGYITKIDVGAVVAGNTYRVSFKSIRSIGDFGTVMALIYNTAGTTLMGNSEAVDSDAWVEVTFEFVASSSTNMRMRFRVLGDTGTTFRVDQVSIKEVTAPLAYTPLYTLPDESNGAYNPAFLSGTPIYAGDPPDKDGWFNNENSSIFRFADGADIPAGTDNLWVYYYTDQIIENVVADLMALSGLYPDRATALADMDYTATGVHVHKVWFDHGSTALDAVRILCERVNYRFWFDYAGKPCFKPAPVADVIDFTFTDPGDLQGLADYQDIAVVRNRIVIEGSDRATYASRDDRKMTKWAGEASDPTSIAAYLEKTHNISNHLFQDQVPIDDMCAELLAGFKDPKWYADLQLFANPVPLEIGDIISWVAELEPTAADFHDIDGGWFLDPGTIWLDGGGFSATPELTLSGGTFTGLAVRMYGIIRDIKINDAQSTYTVEVVDSLVGGSGSSS